jgi:hypothetical protein
MLAMPRFSYQQAVFYRAGQNDLLNHSAPYISPFISLGQSTVLFEPRLFNNICFGVVDLMPESSR